MGRMQSGVLSQGNMSHDTMFIPHGTLWDVASLYISFNIHTSTRINSLSSIDNILDIVYSTGPNFPNFAHKSVSMFTIHLISLS